MARLTGDDVRAVRFAQPGWGKRGYAPDDVDDFLDHAAAALDALAAGQPPAMAADDVQRVVFGKPPIGKRGYAEREVDDFLDQLAASFPGAGGTTGVELNGEPLGR